ncbi:MAG: pseudouridine synthase [Gemmatimonas sp.]
MSLLVKYLSNLGYGSRRDVARLLEQQRVTDARAVPMRANTPFTHDDLRVDDRPIDPAFGSVVMLHKPTGFVCSTTDASNPVVYALLPARFRARSPMMAPVGRLDLDTSGLLLLTDDGALNHRLTSPKSHVSKVYVATLAEPLRGDERERFASGTLTLAADAAPLLPVGMEVLDTHTVQLTLAEGRYHQVRRMFAAVGNHVLQLHRVAIGALTLGDLPVGTWRVLTNAERALLAPRATPSAPTTP